MTIQESDSSRRESLGFVEAVMEYVAPVLAERGFNCTDRTPYWVKFRSSNVYLEIFHEPLDFEINAACARQASPRERYGLPDMLRVLLGPGQKQKGYFQASTRDGVVESVRIIAYLLQTYGEPVLTGDPAIYQQIGEAARQGNEASTKQIVQSPIREAAESAWKGKNYRRVRELYESIEADLTPIEKKRLDYARAHSSGA